MTARRPPIAWIAGGAAVPLLFAIGLIAGAQPRFGIAAALVLVYAVLVFTNLSAALTVLIIIVFAESTPLAGPALSATKIAGMLLVLGWIARVATEPETRRSVLFAAHPALSYLLVSFVAWVLLSTTWARDGALAFDAAVVFLLVAILYLIVFTAIRDRRQAIWVIGALVLGTAFTAAYGLVLRPDPNTQTSERLASTINDPNFLAAILVVGLVLGAAAFFAARGHRLLQFGALIAVGLSFVAFLLTGSRGGIVGLGVALIAGIALGGRWRLRIALGAALATVLLVGYYTMFAPPLLKQRIVAATAGEVSRADTRSTIWTVAWRMAEDHPVTGVGIGNFEARSVEYILQPGTTYRTDRVIDNPGVAHNSYLGPFAEIGIIGVIMLLGIIVLSLACTVQAYRRFERNRDGPMEVLTRGLLIALIGILTSAFFISAESNKVIWLMMAMGPALLAVAESAPPARHPVRRGPAYGTAPRSAAVRPLARPS
ncbi:MAG: O-antigen ligase family protein [Solirubrobacterales bacterium]|nr:O-antigen ligase family protein [Solirubrobacterales bacterium]